MEAWHALGAMPERKFDIVMVRHCVVKTPLWVLCLAENLLVQMRRRGVRSARHESKKTSIWRNPLLPWCARRFSTNIYSRYFVAYRKCWESPAPLLAWCRRGGALRKHRSAVTTAPNIAPVLHRSGQLTVLAEGRTAAVSWDAGRGVAFRT